MDEKVFEGKDLEEALESAAQSLGVPQAELHYEIVEQGRRGVFGLGAKSVQIRVIPPLDDEPIDVDEAARPAAAQGRGRSRRSARNRNKPKERPEAEPEPEEPRELTPEAAEVEATTARILELMGLDLDVMATPADDGMSLKFKGSDRKMLTARNGELQSALQLLLNRMARRTWPEAGRIYVGNDGSPRKRDDELIAMTKKIAKQVSKTGKTRKMQPMNAYERRLVHLTVREFPGLSSSSDGDGSRKRVRISKVQNAPI